MIRSLVLLASLLLLFLPGAAHADSKTVRAMQEQFNQMSNLTPPGAAMGARRGVISGGSISIRNRITQSGAINLVSTQPLSFNTGDGCGGIDLYAGSLSAVNGDQLKEVGRQIASQATTYAFHLALGSLCSQCQNIMQQVNDILQEFNFQLQDTCTLAKGIVQLAPGDQEGDKERKEIQAGFQSMFSGDSADAFRAFGRPRAGAETPTQRLQTRGTEEEREAVIPGNLLWRAMRKANAGAWTSVTGGDDKAFMEELLSLVGSIQICHATDPQCQSSGADAASTLTREIPPILSLAAFIEGSNASGTSTQNAPNITRSQVYFCSDSQNCLNPQSGPMQFKGMRTYILEAFNGTPGGDGGIIAKQTGDATGEMTAFQTAILGYHNELGALITQAITVQPDGTHARMIVQEFSSQIAAEFTYEFLTEMLRSMRSAVALHIHDASKATQIQMIERAQARLDLEYSQIRANPQTVNMMVARADQLTRFGVGGTPGAQRGETPRASAVLGGTQ